MEGVYTDWPFANNNHNYACVYSLLVPKNFIISYPVVGDVAKLDMFNVHGLAIQWLVMWQSWICSIWPRSLSSGW